MPRSLIALLAVVLLIAAGSQATAQRAQVAPEAASGRTEKALQTARTFMVSAATPLAVDAGVAILKAGGSAADAAITVQLVLNLVEPQSSGLGGGAFLLHWDAARQDLATYDGRETAPLAAGPDRFLRDGKPLPFDTAAHSGLSIGTPGVPRLLEAVHKTHGRLPWAQLFARAIELAELGFPVSARLHHLLTVAGAAKFDATARAYFFDAEGRPHPIGYRLANPAFASTLKALRDGGAATFDGGATAAAVVAAVATAPNYPGDLTIADMAAYRIETRAPICISYRLHRVCSMGPPSSGGLAVAQTLGLLEGFDLGRGPAAANDPRAMHLIAEAQKLAFADRDRFIADPAFIRIPSGLLDRGYLLTRGRLIDPQAAMARPPAGQPPGIDGQLFGIDGTREGAGTSHISIVDAAGNAVAMTTSIETAFGARVMAAGFLLNNQLTDFAFTSRDAAGAPVANAVGPGKRPRSSMAPTLIFDPEGRLMAVLGSPGGSRIILYVIKAVIALVDWELDAQAAASLINFGSRGAAFELEDDPALRASALVSALRRIGHTVAPDPMTSGLQIIRIRPDRLEGGADPRREGIAAGD